MQNYNGFNYGNFNNPYQQFNHPQTSINQGVQSFKMIPVSSKNEVNSFITDFNGTPVYFHNQATNEIYIKQFDIKTGLAKIQEFKHAESDLSHVENENNINSYQENFNAINERLDAIEQLLKPPAKIEKESKK